MPRKKKSKKKRSHEDTEVKTEVPSGDVSDPSRSAVPVSYCQKAAEAAEKAFKPIAQVIKLRALESRLLSLLYKFAKEAENLELHDLASLFMNAIPARYIHTRGVEWRPLSPVRAETPQVLKSGSRSQSHPANDSSNHFTTDSKNSTRSLSSTSPFLPMRTRYSDESAQDAVSGGPAVLAKPYSDFHEAGSVVSAELETAFASLKVLVTTTENQASKGPRRAGKRKGKSKAKGPTTKANLKKAQDSIGVLVNEIRQLQREVGFLASRLNARTETVMAPIKILRAGVPRTSVDPIEKCFVNAELCGKIRIEKHLSSGGFGRGWQAVLKTEHGDERVFVKTFGTEDELPHGKNNTMAFKTRGGRSFKSNFRRGVLEDDVRVEASIYMHPWFPTAVEHPGAANARLCYGSVRYPNSKQPAGNIFFVCGELCSGRDLHSYGHMERSYPEVFAKRLFGQIARGLLMMKHCGGRGVKERGKSAKNIYTSWDKFKAKFREKLLSGSQLVNGCFHRDLKFENLILTGDFDCKIIDYGSLKFTEHNGLNESYPILQQEIGDRIVFECQCPWAGTLHMRDPSRWYLDTPTTIDPAAWDVWAAGVTLTFMVGGDHISKSLGSVSVAYNIFRIAMEPAKDSWKIHYKNGTPPDEPSLLIQQVLLESQRAQLRAEELLHRNVVAKNVMVYTLTGRGKSNESYLFSSLIMEQSVHLLLQQTKPGEHYSITVLPERETKKCNFGTDVWEVGRELVYRLCNQATDRSGILCDANEATWVDATTPETPVTQNNAAWVKQQRVKAVELADKRMQLDKQIREAQEHRSWLQFRRTCFDKQNPFYDSDPNTGKPLRVDENGVPIIERDENGTPVYRRFWEFMGPCGGVKQSQNAHSSHRFETGPPKAKRTRVVAGCDAHPEEENEAHISNVPFSPELRDLLNKMLDIDPRRRITVEEVCEHTWLQSHQAPDPTIDVSAHETPAQASAYKSEMRRRMEDIHSDTTVRIPCQSTLAEAIEKIQPCLVVNGDPYNLTIHQPGEDEDFEIDSAEAQQLMNKTTTQLKAMLRQRNLACSGKKHALVERILTPVGTILILSSGTEDENESFVVFSIDVFADHWIVTWESPPLGAASLAEWHTFAEALKMSVEDSGTEHIIDLSRRRYIYEQWRRRGAWSKTPVNQQKTRRKELFDTIDKDKSGYIDATELTAALRMLNIEVEFDNVLTMIDEADNDNNGELDFDEFNKLMDRLLHEKVDSSTV